MSTFESLYSKAPPQAVIFDMDGVLCDSEAMMCEAAVNLFRNVHHTVVQPEDFTPFIGAGEDRYLGGVAQKYGVTLTMPGDKEQTYAIYLELIRGQLKPLPGAIDMVHATRALGLKTAVATGADRIKMNGSLSEIGLPPGDFDALVTGEDITRAKPDPEIFLAAAELLGLAPSRCMVVEDSTNGVASARAAGCFVLGVGHTFSLEQLTAAGADVVASSLTDGQTDELIRALT